jgi:hypothetical protein
MCVVDALSLSRTASGFCYSSSFSTCAFLGVSGVASHTKVVVPMSLVPIRPLTWASLTARVNACLRASALALASPVAGWDL